MEIVVQSEAYLFFGKVHSASAMSAMRTEPEASTKALSASVGFGQRLHLHLFRLARLVQREPGRESAMARPVRSTSSTFTLAFGSAIFVTDAVSKLDVSRASHREAHRQRVSGLNRVLSST